MSGPAVGAPGGPDPDVADQAPGQARGVTLLVDARGLRCPAPVIRLARAAKDTAPGTVVTVWWTDPAARHDIPAWARMRGYEVVGTEPLPADPRGERTDDADDAAPEPAWATRVRIGA